MGLLFCNSLKLVLLPYLHLCILFLFVVWSFWDCCRLRLARFSPTSSYVLNKGIIGDEAIANTDAGYVLHSDRGPNCLLLLFKSKYPITLTITVLTIEFFWGRGNSFQLTSEDFWNSFVQILSQHTKQEHELKKRESPVYIA